MFCPYEQPSINGTQNSGLVNFVPESRLPFVQISSIFQKRPRRPEPGFKDGFEDMEHEFQFGIFRPEKTGPPFQMFCCSRKFSDRTTQRVVFHLLSNRIFGKILVNGKQPGAPFPWFLAVHHQSLAFRARFYHAKNEAPEEQAGQGHPTRI